MFPLTIDDKYTSMPWDEIDNVIFDVGNVLLAFSPASFLKRALPDQPEIYDKLMEKVYRSPYWTMLDQGAAVDPEEVAQAMAGRDVELIPAIRKLLVVSFDLPQIDEGVEALRACKAHGKKLYVLSNYKSDPFAQACEQHDFFKLFDDFVVSSRVGLTKPDPAIYRHVTDTLRLDPARTLFIDDAPANIECALRMGWQGLCFNRQGKLREFFAE